MKNNNNNFYLLISFVCIFLLQINLNATAQTKGDPIKIIRSGHTLFLYHEKIPFELNSTKLNEEAVYELSLLASRLIKNPNLKVEIGVHNDVQSTVQFSNKITKERASLIKDFLVNYGLKEENIIAKGFGDSQIINKCWAFVKCTEAEHSINKRVEFKIINPEIISEYTFVRPRKR
jgi:outer membrane protein OmpA-like peptidoglycan-associated protein